jgi:putative membrane-bound dehydrogenase-like protein
MSSLLLTTLLALSADPPPQVLDDRLQIQLVADHPDVRTPTGIAVDARGRVLVIESHTHFPPPNYDGPKHDRILMLDDFDPATGKARKITTFFEGTTHTMAIALYHDGSFYVATRMEIFRLRDQDGDGKAEERTPICHLDTPGNYPHNGLSGFAFDFAGNVYFGFGENLGAEYKLIGSDEKELKGGGEGGNIYCCDPEGKNLRRVATGFWNPFALGFDPFGRLFAVDNDPDSRPPCRLLHIVEGGDYGFKFRNGRKGVHPFTAWNGELPGTLPMVAGTGEAPCAVMAYDSDNLPDEYRGDLLVTSWGDHRLERYKLRPRGASFGAEMTQVIRGGENFRPVGLALAPDGSLYMSDWVDKSYNLHSKGRVWRISAKSPAKRPEYKDSWESLASKHGPAREAAVRTLSRHATNRTQAVQVLVSARDEAVQAAAARVLKSDDFYSQALLMGCVGSHPSNNVRAAIVHHLLQPTLGRTRQLDYRQDAEWLDKIVINQDGMPTESMALLLANPECQNYPIPVLARSFWPTYFFDGTGERAGGASKFWAAVRDDPFFLHAVSRTAEKNIVDLRDLRRTIRDPLNQMDSSIVGEKLAVALAARRAEPEELGLLIPELLSYGHPSLQLVGLLWLADAPLKDAQHYRRYVERVLQRPNISRQVFEVAIAVLNRIDGVSPDPKNESGGDAFVLRVLLDEKAAPATRRFALRSLPPDHPSLTAELLTKLLADPEESMRLEAIRSLRQRPDTERWPQLRQIAADENAEPQLRCEALLGLSPGNGDDRKLLFQLTTCDQAEVADEALRALRGFDLNPEEKKQLTALAAKLEGPRKELAERVLMRNPPKNLPKHEDAEAWLKIAEGEGNPQAGERIFYHLRVGGCFRCHEFEGRGYTVGPDLSTIGRSMTRERLVQSLVDPSREIAPQFTSWAIQTTEGEVLTGIHVGDEVDGRMKFADQNGRVFHVHPNDIDQRKPSSQSIMPEGQVDNLTAQELRDLIAFLLRK